MLNNLTLSDCQGCEPSTEWICPRNERIWIKDVKVITSLQWYRVALVYVIPILLHSHCYTNLVLNMSMGKSIVHIKGHKLAFPNLDEPNH